MNFSGKIVKLIMGGAIGSAVVLSAIAITIQPALTKVKTTLLAQSLQPEQVNLRAKQITVRIDGASVGSGIIMENDNNNTYTVLSNWHVMKKAGDYIVQTIDGRVHQVEPNSIKELPGLDLAIFQFQSNQNYQLAEIGNSSGLNEGQNIYFAGYPGELKSEDNRYYRFFTVNLVGILSSSAKNGYSLIYNGEALPGMSGGPVLDRNGLLIGIHGQANININSGGTSLYAIPINTYKQAIANLDKTPLPAAIKPENPKPKPVAEKSPPPPEETIDEEIALEENKPKESENNPTPSEPNPSNEPEETDLPEIISSVPTFGSPNPTTSSNPRTSAKPTESANPTTSSNPRTSAKPTESANPTTSSNPSISAKPTESANPTTSSNPTEPPDSIPSELRERLNIDPKRIVLISQKTGIDYTSLRDLLKEKKWEEADRQTYKLVKQIIKTAKRENRHIYIELKTIAEFSCSDIRTIDKLWKKYSGDKFGFSPQQEIWHNVNQNGDFSTQTWRRFATEVGWKEGEIASASGYLLYEQLDFNPNEAPMGHLPWWFALPNEEQKVIKHLFTRCNFNPSRQQLEAEAIKDNPELQQLLKNDSEGDKPRSRDQNANYPRKEP